MKRLRLMSVAALAGALVTVESCADRPTTAPASPLASVTGSLQQIPLAQCRPLRNKSVSKKVGPAGGVIDLGSYVLTVPPSALTKVVTISATIPKGETVNMVVFHPDGLVFNTPATLRIDYSNCSVTDPSLLRVAVVNDSLQVLYSLASAVDATTQTVSGTVNHFTNYAIAW